MANREHFSPQYILMETKKEAGKTRSPPPKPATSSPMGIRKAGTNPLRSLISSNMYIMCLVQNTAMTSYIARRTSSTVSTPMLNITPRFRLIPTKASNKPVLLKTRLNFLTVKIPTIMDKIELILKSKPKNKLSRRKTPTEMAKKYRTLMEEGNLRIRYIVIAVTTNINTSTFTA